MQANLLNITGASKRFGGLQALSGVDMRIAKGQIYGLIGPNGAGKTTFFNVITGLYTPDSGSFMLDGRPYEPTAVHKVAEAGIARTFQNIRLFGEMTALENVMVGRHVRTRSGVWGAVFKTRFERDEEAAIRRRAAELLDYVGIARYADFPARTLSYGDQRRLEIARALATDPKLLALDEPSMGLSPIMVERVFEVVRDVAAQGTTILLVEQNARLALESASRAYVIDSGLVTMSGDACAMPDDPRVCAACPGEEAAA